MYFFIIVFFVWPHVEIKYHVATIFFVKYSQFMRITKYRCQKFRPDVLDRVLPQSFFLIELQVFPDKLRKYGWDAMEEIEEDPEFSQFTGSGSQQTGNQQLDPTKPPKPKPGEAGARRFLGGTGTEYSHL